MYKRQANGGAKQKVKLSEGLNFVDGNYTKASVDANGVVKYDVTLGKVRDGVDGKPGVDGENGIATVKTVVDTINNSGSVSYTHLDVDKRQQWWSYNELWF